MCIGLVTPAGDTRFEAQATTVQHFLNLTYHLVPKGTEPPRTDIDNVIAAILNSGAPGERHEQPQPCPRLRRRAAGRPVGPPHLGTRQHVRNVCACCRAGLHDRTCGPPPVRLVKADK